MKISKNFFFKISLITCLWLRKIFLEDFNLKKSHKIWVLGKFVFELNDSRLNKQSPMTLFVTRLKKLNKNFIYLLDFRKKN